MPKRKITLEEAFAAFEQHGLQVEVKAVQQDRHLETIHDFLDESAVQLPVAEQLSSKLVKITLYAAHTVGNGGFIESDSEGNKHIVNSGIQSYGPGIVTVPAHLAQHLLHADMLAREADDNLLSTKVKTKVVIPRVTQYGTINCAVQVSEDRGFDLSSFLGNLADGNMYRVQ